MQFVTTRWPMPEQRSTPPGQLPPFIYWAWRSLYAAWDTIGFLCCKHTLLSRIWYFIHQYPQVLLRRAALNQFIPQSVHRVKLYLRFVCNMPRAWKSEIYTAFDSSLQVTSACFLPKRSKGLQKVWELEFFPLQSQETPLPHLNLQHTPFPLSHK